MSPAEAVFFAALGKADPAERAAYLSEACGADADLRRQVDRLLAAHPQVGRFLRDDVAVHPSPLYSCVPGEEASRPRCQPNRVTPRPAPQPGQGRTPRRG